MHDPLKTCFAPFLCIPQRQFFSYTLQRIVLTAWEIVSLAFSRQLIFLILKTYFLFFFFLANMLKLVKLDWNFYFGVCAKLTKPYWAQRYNHQENQLLCPWRWEIRKDINVMRLTLFPNQALCSRIKKYCKTFTLIKAFLLLNMKERVKMFTKSVTKQ